MKQLIVKSSLESFFGNSSSTIAPALFYYRPSMDICIALLSDIHVTTTILSIRPAWMQEVQKMQEQFSVTPSLEMH